MVKCLEVISLLLGQLATGAGVVRFEVTEDASDLPVPCRIHLTNAEGEAQKPERLPFHFDHFTCPGTAELNLPKGRYVYEIERGPERTMAQGEVVVDEGAVTVAAKLHRLVDMPALRWWPGDLHVHRPLDDMPLLVMAEDIYVAPTITWWNERNVWRDRPVPAQPVMTVDGRRYIDGLAGEDERAGGAFLYFGCRRPLDIAGAGEEYPSAMAFLRESSREPGVWIDIEKPFWWDVPIALAHGFGRSIGLANNHMCRSSMFESEAWGKPRDTGRWPPPRGNGYWTQEIYYRILEAGFRLPPSAGSASGVLPNPVGYNRVYVYLEDGMDYAQWWEGLAAGHSFVTNGPLLIARANGHIPGHVFEAAANEILEIHLEATLASRDPISSLEVIRNGIVERTVPVREGARNHSLGTLHFKDSGWFLIRAVADVKETFRFASTAPYYVEVGESKRVSRSAAQFFLDWVNERADRIALDDAGQRAEVMTYVEQARNFWERRIAQANAE